jgi:hypothetical protein
MNGVDLADQRRAAYSTHQRTRRNWLCLFFFLLDVSLVNSHILMQLARDEVFLEAIDAGCNPTVAPFRQVCSAASFRRLLAKELMGTKVPKKQRARRTYVKKTDRFVFHARTKGLEWARAKEAARSSAGGSHKLVTMVKKRRCIVCRFEFKKSKCGRQAPKLTQYECTGCQPATALCGPEGGECWVKWHSGGAEGSA